MDDPTTPTLDPEKERLWRASYDADEYGRWAKLTSAERADAYLTELNLDLIPYIEEDGPFGLQLRHPLLYDIPLMTPVGHLNARYAAKLAEVERCMRERNFPGALMWIEKPYRLSMTYGWSDGMFREELRECLSDAWTSVEFPMRSLTRREALKLFRRAGYMDDSAPTGVNDPEAPPRPTTVQTLWRGSPPRYRRGLSWTSDRERAVWFRDRWGTDHTKRLYEVTVPPHRLLAHFTCRNESEYVIDVQGLVVKEVTDLPQSSPEEAPSAL